MNTNNITKIIELSQNKTSSKKTKNINSPPKRQVEKCVVFSKSDFKTNSPPKESIKLYSNKVLNNKVTTQNNTWKQPYQNNTWKQPYQNNKWKKTLYKNNTNITKIHMPQLIKEWNMWSSPDFVEIIYNLE